MQLALRKTGKQFLLKTASAVLKPRQSDARAFAQMNPPTPRIALVRPPMHEVCGLKLVNHLPDGGSANFQEFRQLRLRLSITAIQVGEHAPSRTSQANAPHARIEGGARKARRVREREAYP